jgi:hypothetical protein
MVNVVLQHKGQEEGKQDGEAQDYLRFIVPLMLKLVCQCRVLDNLIHLGRLDHFLQYNKHPAPSKRPCLSLISQRQESDASSQSGI